MIARYLTERMEAVKTGIDLAHILKDVPFFRQYAFMNGNITDTPFVEIADTLRKADALIFPSLLQGGPAMAAVGKECLLVADSVVIIRPDYFSDEIHAVRFKDGKVIMHGRKAYSGGIPETAELKQDFRKLSALVNKPEKFQKMAKDILSDFN